MSKNKYYAITARGDFELESIEQAREENPYLIIKGRVVETEEANRFISRNKLVRGPSQENEASEKLRISDLQIIFDVSRQTIYAWEKSGKLPTPIKFGREKFWFERDINEIKQRDSK